MWEATLGSGQAEVNEADRVVEVRPRLPGPRLGEREEVLGGVFYKPKLKEQNAMVESAVEVVRVEFETALEHLDCVHEVAAQRELPGLAEVLLGRP